ncbi:Uncharacterised protein [Bordetella pertussis]|nr:Uncharacterised protein [Bordetella pertussis]CFU08228.1 Uncharacterised protein [Bordetella pertussis]
MASPMASWPSWSCTASSDWLRKLSRPPSWPPVTSLSFISTWMVVPGPDGSV